MLHELKFKRFRPLGLLVLPIIFPSWFGNSGNFNAQLDMQQKPNKKYLCVGFATWAGWAALGWAGYVAKPKQTYFCLGFATWASWAGLGWVESRFEPPVCLKVVREKRARTDLHAQT